MVQILTSMPLLAALMLAGLAAEGAQAEMVALVLEKRGSVTPDVQPFHEIQTGATITVPKGATLVFLHYESCKTVKVTGTTVRFHDRSYAVSEGGAETGTKGPCPRKVKLKTTGEMAGVVTRSLSGGGPLTLPPRPVFVLVGRQADDFALVRVSKGDHQVLEAPLEGPRFAWPSEAPALQPEAEYELLFIPKVLGVGKVKKTFRVAVGIGAAGGHDLVLLDLD